VSLQNQDTPSVVDRRPLKSRETKWAKASAAFLAKHGIKPNQISLMSVLFSILCAICFFMHLFLLAAGFIQLRLLCNLLDGMVAIEGKMQSKTGPLYNEIPDRPADVIILVSAGYAAPPLLYGTVLGWLSGCLALMTAYVRVLGASLGTPHFFSGPMAKQHRMAVLTVASIASWIASFFDFPAYFLTFGLAIIVLGSILTVIRRTLQIASELNSK
jgi:phosphatidylglycerophosphate synthase